MTHPSNDVSRFALFTEYELAALPPPVWLIDGVLPSDALTVLVGERSSYKSFLALDWAAHVVLGFEWHGRRVRPGTVVYIYAEGRSGIYPRLEAWKQFNTYPHPVEILFLPQSVLVNDPGDTAELLAAIRSRAPGGVSLIVVDTLNRNFVGNENSTEDMTAFIRGCDRIREATGATVLVVHHKGHGEADRGRGSSALDAAADTVIMATRDDDRVTLSCKKQKDAAEFADLALEAVPVGPSLALNPSGVNAGKLNGQRLACLRVLHDQYTAETGASHNAWHKATGIGSSSFSKAREWLAANSYVVSNAGKYRVTDAGRLVLGGGRSTHSTSTPPVQSGAPSIHSTPLGGGLYRPPGGVVDETAAA
jgi:hypothetical protein